MCPIRIPPRLGIRVYTNGFNRDTIHECEEASLEVPCEVFLGKKAQGVSSTGCWKFGHLASFVLAGA